MGGYMLKKEHQEPAGAIHLLFAGEKSESTRPLPHPQVDPVQKRLSDISIPVANLRDLLVTTLNSLRAKEIAHLEVLDETGLITPEIERALPPVLLERLQQARTTIANEKPDLEF